MQLYDKEQVSILICITRLAVICIENKTMYLLKIVRSIESQVSTWSWNQHIETGTCYYMQ